MFISSIEAKMKFLKSSLTLVEKMLQWATILAKGITSLNYTDLTIHLLKADPEGTYKSI